MQFSKMFLLTLLMTCVMTLLHVVQPSPVPASASVAKTSDLEIEEFANSLPMTNSRAARTDSVWSSKGNPAMRRGKLLNLHRP